MKIGIVGCGNLGTSILEGGLKYSNELQFVVSKRKIGVLSKLEGPRCIVTTDNVKVFNECDIILLTLKPYAIKDFIDEHREFIDKYRHTIVSCATGVSIDDIKQFAQSDLDVFRAMPNTAAAVSESITMLSKGTDSFNREEAVKELFGAIGEVIFIDESLMESATILGACGVAYVLRFMRAMIQGGIEVGFDAKTATKIVSHTMKGAAELIIQNDSHPEEEIDKVTTPKGCTIVGLNEMEHAGFSSALIKGIVASFEKIERKN